MLKTSLSRWTKSFKPICSPKDVDLLTRSLTISSLIWKTSLTRSSLKASSICKHRNSRSILSSNRFLIFLEIRILLKSLRYSCQDWMRLFLNSRRNSRIFLKSIATSLKIGHFYSKQTMVMLLSLAWHPHATLKVLQALICWSLKVSQCFQNSNWWRQSLPPKALHFIYRAKWPLNLFKWLRVGRMPKSQSRWFLLYEMAITDS